MTNSTPDPPVWFKRLRANLRETRRAMAKYSGTQPGDPARAAQAIIRALQLPAPPAHLVLGREGLENVERQLRGELEEIERCKEISLSADYPS